MRWPLRNQILSRTLLLLAVTIFAITYANIQSTIASARMQEQQRMEQIISVIEDQSFPITESVLGSLQGLSDAEFLLTNSDGNAEYKTRLAPDSVPGRSSSVGKPVALPVGDQTQSFFHASIPRIGRQGDSGDGWLHVFLRRQSEASVWWQAGRLPLMIAFITLPIACLVSFALASQVTQPLAELQRRVRTIAEGELGDMDALDRNDEISDLSTSVNQMAARLRQNEDNLKQQERYQALFQVGNGMAHQLRNSATGCKMALEFLADEYQAREAEGYLVAARQLSLIDNYISNFLKLSKNSVLAKNGELVEDWTGLLETVVSQLRPSAIHLDVALTHTCVCEQAQLRMSRDDAEQLLMNLMLNAIAAASRPEGHRSFSDSDVKSFVDVSLIADGMNFALRVTDSGPGPSKQIADRLFEPFVTGSPEGTGLGLSLVKDIADRVGATVDWERKDQTTIFSFTINECLQTGTRF